MRSGFALRSEGKAVGQCVVVCSEGSRSREVSCAFCFGTPLPRPQEQLGVGPAGETRDETRDACATQLNRCAGI